MIFHFLIVQVHFVLCQLNFIVLYPFLLKYQILFVIIIVFRLGSNKLVSCFFYCLSQGSDVTPPLRECGLFFIFNCSSPFCFLLIEIHNVFSIFYIVLTFCVYYYCI